jgi:delta14-sterol reductase
LSVAAKQFQNQGSLSLSMALYQAFSAIYVLDYFWHEEAMTSTREVWIYADLWRCCVYPLYL